MARGDFYASPFGVFYSAYMERPRISRIVSRTVFGGATAPYYESMGSVSEVPDGGLLVDCPCGAGPVLRALPRYRGLRYVGVDLSPSMLRRARKRSATRRLDGIELIESDATEIPVATGSADLFLSYWGLHCFPDPPAALAEAARVLRPGGRLVGSSFTQGRDTIRQRLLIRPHTTDFGPIGTYAEQSHWLEQAGFELTSERRSGPFLFFDARTSPASAPG